MLTRNKCFMTNEKSLFVVRVARYQRLQTLTDLLVCRHLVGAVMKSLHHVAACPETMRSAIKSYPKFDQNFREIISGSCYILSEYTYAVGDLRGTGRAEILPPLSSRLRRIRSMCGYTCERDKFCSFDT